MKNINNDDSESYTWQYKHTANYIKREISESVPQKKEFSKLELCPHYNNL